MRIAFYAPLKAPSHPVPSGDREMARNLMQMLGDNGAEVILASELRLRDGSGDVARQARLAQDAALEIDRLARELPDDVALWVTYHNYYKAPDLIGPELARRRGMPYVLIESSRARSRLTGPWADFAHAAEAASDAADAIFYVTQLDRETLERDRPAGQILAHLPPFLATPTLPPAGRPIPGRLLAAGMMRPGDKMASYRLIAQALPALTHPDWHLDIAGGGPAADRVRHLFDDWSDRVTFLGQLDQDGLAQAYDRADLFLWPGVNEAFGMVYLEAQARGVPVVAQDRPGVRDVLAPGPHPPETAGAAGLALRCDWLMDDPARRQEASLNARAHVARTHLRPAAATQFWSVVGPLIADPA